MCLLTLDNDSPRSHRITVLIAKQFNNSLREHHVENDAIKIDTEFFSC